MIKKIAAAAAVLLITASLILSGCSGNISETDYNKVVSERDQALAQAAGLQTQVANLQTEIEAIEADLENLDSLETELEAVKLEKTALETKLNDLQFQKTSLESDIRAIYENIGRGFVENESTYVFDGMEETLVMAGMEYSAEDVAWFVTFRFDSRQAGYGDREGQMLAQVITPHEAVLKYQQGNLISAIMDGQWNMVKQRMVYAIEEVTWVMTSFTPGDTEYQALENVEVTLFLDSTTRYLGGNSGCNSYGTWYEIDENTLTLSGEIIQTLMACADEAVSNQEHDYIKGLHHVESWVVENDTLTLTGNDWTIELVKQQ